VNAKKIEFILKTVLEVAKVVYELFSSKNNGKDNSDEKSDG